MKPIAKRRLYKKELDQFYASRKIVSSEPIQFWKDTKDFLLLKFVAETVLPVAATSASVERKFVNSLIRRTGIFSGWTMLRQKIRLEQCSFETRSYA